MGIVVIPLPKVQLSAFTEAWACLTSTGAQMMF